MHIRSMHPTALLSPAHKPFGRDLPFAGRVDAAKYSASGENADKYLRPNLNIPHPESVEGRGG